MVSTLYWPTHGLRQDRGLVVGWTIEDVAIVVGIVDDWMVAEISKSHYFDLQVLGSSRSDGISQGSIGLEIEVDKRSLKWCSTSARVVLFDPPDPVRLRYFKTASHASSPPGSSLLERQDAYGIGRNVKSVGTEQIIRLLNRTRATQRSLNGIRKSTQGRTLFDLPRIDFTSLWVVTLFFSPLGIVLSFIHRVTCFEIFGTSLRNLSSTLKQISSRCSQILTAPTDFRSTLHDPTVPLHIRSARYVAFWNTVWLILNDLVLGYCVRELLVIGTNADMLVDALPSFLNRFMIKDVISALAWLDEWPVGLKLNTPLSRFFRSTFSIIITTWGDIVIPLLASHGMTALLLLRVSGYGGLTLFLSFLRDSINVLTFHLRLCHLIMRYLVKWQLSSLGGLWNLFRGKKWNVLRQRTDSYAYDVDQLFLGTLLFTVSAFLLPTVLTYAALFSAIRAGLWLVDEALETFTQALNAFPLFEVLLSIKEPSRLPDGIVFRLRHGITPGGGKTPQLELRNAPKSLASILFKRRDCQ